MQYGITIDTIVYQMTQFVINTHLCSKCIVWLLILAKLFYCVSPDPCVRGLGTRLCCMHVPLIIYLSSRNLIILYAVHCTHTHTQQIYIANLLVNFCANYTYRNSQVSSHSQLSVSKKVWLLSKGGYYMKGGTKTLQGI